MFQRFHENTQLSRVVKNLLATEPIPLLQTVHKGTPVVEGCKYLYDGRVIECTKSGLLTDNFDPLAAGEVSTSVHKSSVSWYDDATHKYLGNYLRYLRDTKSINLMPYYNCYNATELTDVYIKNVYFSPLLCSEDKITNDAGEEVYKVVPSNIPPLYCGVRQQGSVSKGATYGFGSNSDYKVVAVPVKFDTTYTIAVECDSVVSLRGIIYDPEGGMIKEHKLYPEQSSVTYYSDYLEHSSVTLPFTRFNEPFTYRVNLVSKKLPYSSSKLKELYARQKDLYLLMQLPANVDSSIVVLEGEYTQKHLEITQGSMYPSPEDDKEIERSSDEYYRMQDLETTYKNSFIPEDFDNDHVEIKYPDNLSLLYYNTGVSYAFSDRLIEYLLLNVVTELETLPTNVARVQKSLAALYPSYNKRMLTHVVTSGVWDDSIIHYVKSFLSKNINNVTIPLDHDGYINKDVESLLSQKGVYVT